MTKTFGDSVKNIDPGELLVVSSTAGPVVLLLTNHVTVRSPWELLGTGHVNLASALRSVEKASITEEENKRTTKTTAAQN